MHIISVNYNFVYFDGNILLTFSVNGDILKIAGRLLIMGLEKISELKKKLGLTNEELSRLSGVPKGTIDKILSGVTKDPKLETLKAIARVLGCALDDFNDAENKPEPSEPTYEDLQQLIARNGKNLSTEEKMKLIKMLSEL